MAWFVAENGAILAARDARGRRLPVEFFGPEGISRIERKLGELVALLARSWWWEVPVGASEFAEFRESALEVQVRLRCLLGDGYRILKWVEFWERLFFRGRRVPLPGQSKEKERNVRNSTVRLRLPTTTFKERWLVVVGGHPPFGGLRGAGAILYTTS